MAESEKYLRDYYKVVKSEQDKLVPFVKSLIKCLMSDDIKLEVKFNPLLVSYIATLICLDYTEKVIKDIEVKL